MSTLKNAVRYTVAGALVLGLFAATGSQAVARPKYCVTMASENPEFARKFGTDGKLKCDICHVGNDKKLRNNFGAEFGKALTKKNETDEAKIKEALTKAGMGKSATEGKTFGDLIKALELPGTAEAAK